MRARLAGLLPFGLLVVAALAPPARLPVLLGLATVTAVAASRARRVAGNVAVGAWAAAVPIGVSLSWGLVVPPIAPGGADCANPASPFAVWRVAEALLAVGTLVVVGLLTGAAGRAADRPRASTAPAVPRGRLLAASIAGFVVSGPLALLVGPWLAAPFFGQTRLAVGTLGAIPPALIFAAANAVMEELEYRAAALGWSEPALGARTSLLAQAVVFGAAHTGPGFLGSPLPVAAAMAVAALMAGWLARRTASLALPIAVHAGCDLPLYYYWACPHG
ncbi:MAG TPA: CPBP family intramembrane glutamic endopeptidase [Candidatus Limnocylindrales bacterium]